MVSVHSCQISAFQDLYFKKYKQNYKNAKVLLFKPVASTPYYLPDSCSNTHNQQHLKNIMTKKITLPSKPQHASV